MRCIPATTKPRQLDTRTSVRQTRMCLSHPPDGDSFSTSELKRTGRPELGMAPGAWFRQALQTASARLATITPAIAAEAASVPAIYGRGDPGDCFLIATARVRRLSLVTRDGPILQLAAALPSYVQVVEC